MIIDLSSRKGANAALRRVRVSQRLRTIAKLLEINELAQVGESPLTIINNWARCSSIRIGPSGRVELKRGKVWVNDALTDFAYSYDPGAVTEAARTFGLAIHY